MRHRPSRWIWGSDDGTFEDSTDFAEYCHAEKCVRLHPRLRNKAKHDELWRTLGHEFIHQVHKDNGSTKANEARAYRLEQAAGEVLHDFYHRFRKSGIPRCTGAKCKVTE